LLEYLVVGPRGEPLAGHLSRAPARSGWTNLDYRESDGDVTRLRVLLAPVAGGTRLVIAADREQIEKLKQAVFDGFLSAFGAVVALGTLGGIALSFALLKRVETIRRTAGSQTETCCPCLTPTVWRSAATSSTQLSSSRYVRRKLVSRRAIRSGDVLAQWRSREYIASPRQYLFS
jgi:hypothetical protein